MQVVGLRLNHIALQEVDADGRCGMFADESLDGLGHLGRHELTQLHAQLGHLVVVITTGDGHFLHVRGIALDGNQSARLSKHGLFGKVWEYQHKGGLVTHFRLVCKASLLHLDSIYADDTAVRTIYQKFCLIHVAQSSL